ncbi:hypothetical protein FHR59_001882 [Xanthomonas arboricola]|uniref:hypothetical protein n=1 Tax=Xanthomonas arboricola TaxID=56448 RepID=UPI001612EE8B|nr:hypothetical protein [Xanthomonas arboricola]MBB6337672.1 hypothetical protein [Xanthomonas arboricola]
MSSPEIQLWFYAKPDRALTIEQRHAQVMEQMSRVGSPLGFEGLDLPAAPSCGDGLSASYKIKFPVKGLLCIGDYIYRGERYVYEDHGSFDEHLRFGFKISNIKIDYRNVLNTEIQEITQAFGAYKAFASYDLYSVYYQGNGPDENPVYDRLRKEKSIDVDGRNNIYTLHPVQFWDGDRCRSALGYGPDEVVARLQGKVQRVERFLDGVFLLLNDDPGLTYEQFVEMNERVKPILGLI